MEYRILKHTFDGMYHKDRGFADMEKLVTIALNDGWTLSGGISLTVYEYNYTLAQAVVRPKPSS